MTSLKLILKFVTIFILCMGNLQAWEIKEDDNGYFIKNRLDRSYLVVLGGKPEIKTIKKKDPLEIIIYDAGETGTSAIIQADYALVYHSKKKKILGTYPYKYVEKTPHKKKLSQPKWDFKQNELTIKDENSNVEETIPY